MVSHDEKIPIRAGFFGDDSEILPEQNQKEVAEKQVLSTHPLSHSKY